MRHRCLWVLLCAPALLVVAATRAAPAQVVRFDGHKVIQVDVQTTEQLDALLEMNVDFWSHRIGVGLMDVRVSPEQLAAIDKTDMQYTVSVHDVQELIDLQRIGVRGLGFFDDYRTYDEVSTFLNGLVTQRPDLASTLSFGLTIEGRPMIGIRITGPGGADKPEVLYHGGEHAREWITVPLICYVAQYLIDNYGIDPLATELVDRVEWYLLPIMNPDGYVYSWDTNRMWRKNRRYNGGGSYGVDLNRNWEYGWGGAGSSGDPNSETYRGPTPFSEPETQNMRDFAIAHPDLMAYFDYHSYSQLHLWPWGYTPTLPPDQATYQLLGFEHVDIIYAVHGKTYIPGPVNTTIYPASGVSVDYMYGQHGILSFTTELRPESSNPGFLLPPEEIIPTCEEITPALLRTTDWITAPLRISVPFGLPDILAPNVDNHITVQITANTENPAPGGAALYYRTSPGDPFGSTTMSPLGDDLYDAVLPARGCGDPTEFYFSATGDGGGVVTLPADAPATLYSAPVGTVTQIVQHDFETDPGWTVSGDATDGQWDRGVPVGGGDRGDPPTDYDGSGQCWLTDNVDGNSDVDGGTTTLTTSAFDLSALADPQVTYARWYSNHTGSAPESDIFVVEISDNDGLSWVGLETVGPSGAEVRGGWFVTTFRVADFVTPTDRVRIRWSASDLGSGSVVEAGLDAFGIFDFGCESAGPPGDFDGDGDVDLDDFGSFSACYNGALNPPAGTCPPGVDADLDDDGDVDLDDFAIFAANYTGSL